MTLITYKDRRGQWRWHVRTDNGRIVAESGQGYTRRDHCLRMATKVLRVEHAHTIRIALRVSGRARIA